MSTDQVSPDLELPSWIVYACIRSAPTLMCLPLLQVAWTYLKTGDLPHHDARMSTASKPARPRRSRLEKAISAAIIFGLLFALMLTGMPISISLGLTVRPSCSR